MAKKTAKASADPSSDEPIKPRKRTGPQCSAMKKNGQRCGNPPLQGATVCRFHGGAAKQVREKATERLLEMVMPAIAKLRKVMLDPKTSDADALRAIQMLLNRTGFSERFGLDLIAQQQNDDAFAPILADVQSGWDSLTAEEKRDALAGGGELAQLMGQTDRLQSQGELTSSTGEWGWGEESPVHQGEDLDQLNITSLRNSNRDQADRESSILRDDDNVVRGTVLKATDIRQGAYSPVRSRLEGLDEESEWDPTPTRNGRTRGKARTTRERVIDDLGAEDGRRR